MPPPRNRSSSERGSPARGGAHRNTAASSSSSSASAAAGGGGSHHNAGHRNHLPEAVPETPAELYDRLKAERQDSLEKMNRNALKAVTAEEVGIELANEIAEKAVELYIDKTYNELANEYTALALWDEMIDAIGNFQGAVASSLPQNSGETVEQTSLALLEAPGILPLGPTAEETAAAEAAAVKKASAAAMSGGGGAIQSSMKGGSGTTHKVRRVRVAEPEKDDASSPSSSSSSPGAATSPTSGGGDENADSKIIQARAELAAAVEAKLKGEQQQQQQNKKKGGIQNCTDFKLECEPPSEIDPSWAPDALPPVMMCDLTARHAATLKLKLVDRPATTESASTMEGGGGGSGGAAANRRSRIGRSMIGGGRPSSGTVINNQSAAATRVARPLSPTEIALGNVAKDNVPIAVLTHHLSMMASSSPYKARKSDSNERDEEQRKLDKRKRDLMEGSPPEDGEENYEGQRRFDEVPSVASGPTSPAFGQQQPFSMFPGDGGEGGAGESQSQQSSFESFEDEDSQQSPSELEVAQKLQQRQAQKTRNANAYDRINNQLSELMTGSGGPLQQQQQSQSTFSSTTFGGGGGGTTKQGAASAEKSFIVDTRIGRVIPVSSIESGGGGGKKGGSSKVNPLTDAPKFQVQLPPPPPEPETGREGRYRRFRQQQQQQTASSASPERTTTTTTTTTTTGGTEEQQQQQTTRSSSSPRTAYVSPIRKKVRRRDKDPSNFFQPEAKISPMIQLMNPSGGVCVKDDNGSRRNERPTVAAKMTRQDYAKMIRVAPSITAANAADFNFGNQQERKEEPQTARANLISKESSSSGVTFEAGNNAKTARNK